jgi:hypothetical protein
MATIIAAGKASGKPLLVAGCVPQGDRKAAELKGLSLLGETLLFVNCIWFLIASDYSIQNNSRRGSSSTHNSSSSRGEMRHAVAALMTCTAAGYSTQYSSSSSSKGRCIL